MALNTNKLLFKLLMIQTLFKDQDLLEMSQDPAENVHSCYWLTHMALVDIYWRHG